MHSLCARIDLRAPVAQLDRAFASEAKGRLFESSRVHHLTHWQIKRIIMHAVVYGDQTADYTSGEIPAAVFVAAVFQSVSILTY